MRNEKKSTSMIWQHSDDEVQHRPDWGVRFRPATVAVGLALLITVPLSTCAATGDGGASTAAAAATVSAVTVLTAPASSITATPSASVLASSVALSQLTNVSNSTAAVPAAQTPSSSGSLSLTPTASVSESNASSISIGAIPIAGVPAATATALAPESREVIGIFERFLEVYADALRTLDPSHLTDVLSGQALQVVADEINGLKAQGKPVELIENNHHVGFDQLTNNSAVLVDEYDSASVYINPTTGAPLSRTGPQQRIRMVYQFSKISNAWKIVESAQKVMGTVTP